MISKPIKENLINRYKPKINIHNDNRFSQNKNTNGSFSITLTLSNLVEDEK